VGGLAQTIAPNSARAWPFENHAKLRGVIPGQLDQSELYCIESQLPGHTYPELEGMRRIPELSKLTGFCLSSKQNNPTDPGCGTTGEACMVFLEDEEPCSHRRGSSCDSSHARHFSPRVTPGKLWSQDESGAESRTGRRFARRGAGSLLLGCALLMQYGAHPRPTSPQTTPDRALGLGELGTFSVAGGVRCTEP